jgi:PII-like signaling protein
VATLERVQICRSRGLPTTPPRRVRERDDAGMPVWQKLMIHAEEQARHAGHPLHVSLIRRLREERAAGATVLRGVRGFYGDNPPFADRFLSVQRHAPVHAVIVDTPPNIERLWPTIEELTRESGLVTSELVPAVHAPGAAREHALHGDRRARLARPWG